jgi:hypothetical protein
MIYAFYPLKNDAAFYEIPIKECFDTYISQSREDISYNQLHQHHVTFETRPSTKYKMAMNAFRKITWTLVLLFGTLGCEKDVPFPKLTQEGLNTFGVKINGVKWFPKAGLSFTGGGHKLRGWYLPQEHVVAIEACKGVNDEVIILTVVDVKGVGAYHLNADSTKGSKTQFHGKNIDDRYFLLSTENNTLIITKLDTVEKVISGTFNAHMVGLRNQTVKKLSEGVFDIRYE